MEDHDQRLKELLRLFFRAFLDLILPAWADRFDLAALDWQQQEVFTDPPSGKMRRLDLVARLPRRDPPAGTAADLLALVEIGAEDKATRLRKQFAANHRALRARTDADVLPLALYLQVALQGRGLDSYVEEVEGLEVFRFNFPYLALPGLEARQHVEGDNPLAVALSVLMRGPDAERGWLKARAMQRIATAPLNDMRKYLLMECVEAYAPLEGPALKDFERLLVTPDYQEARMLGVTSYEKGRSAGRDEGQRVLLLRQMEKRFGALSEEVKAAVQALPHERLLQLGDDLLTATSLADLGLAPPAATGR